MKTRDLVERTLRAWNQHEIDRGASAVIDFDFRPPPDTSEPPVPTDRLTTFRQLSELLEDANDPAVSQRINADLAYLRALMGERAPLDEYIRATQGCPATGWPAEYITEKGEIARQCLAALHVGWGESTAIDLDAAEGPIDAADAPDAIRSAAIEYEADVRRATGSDAVYELTIEAADVDAYWAYWLDGAGQQVRLRLNMRNASYTKVQARQFALHEVLGHGLQSASIAARCADEDVPWVRLLSVHGPQQVLLEGWAQAAPLFITPDDRALIARVRIDHYSQLVRAELHRAVNNGTPIEECAQYARTHVPWWTDSQIASLLADRSTSPQLRTYMWAYAAGIDWFANLADSDPAVIQSVLRSAYRAPLTPTDLERLWPKGPAVGGPRGLPENHITHY
ncbi:hypothetical protein HLB23_40440 [Nocardia uniformis]|uniref:DUF1704 domain-containing protein n=1 Tax=Nocardia uniformis TaxID=53432 RepID=A0A849CIE4_9NOCA|nr:hypothetical protein [Nocardia uniformis]NNH76049.1 hypothetical protein [Nocardia uniformis]